MDELWKFAEDGNADQVYAILESGRGDEELDTIRRGYENGYLEDKDFCKLVYLLLDAREISSKVK